MNIFAEAEFSQVDPGVMLENIEWAVGSVVPFDWSQDPPVSVGKHQDPNLSRLPGYSLEFRDRGNVDNNYADHKIEGEVDIRVYVRDPAGEPELGKRRAHSLSRAIFAAIKANKADLDILTFQAEGSNEEQLSYAPDVSIVRTQYRVVF